MASVVSCTTVTQVGPKFYINFSDGLQMEFQSLQEIQDTIAELDTTDVARRILMGWWLARSADGSNQNLIEGKTVTWDLANANPFRVQ